MATIKYNEVTHATGIDLDSMDPLYKWEAHFPERLSRLNMEELGPSSPGSKNACRNRRNRNRNSARFKTQPITFDEIKEVDEDRLDDDAKKELRNQFAAFSRSMDGMLAVTKKEVKGKKKSPAVTCVAAQAAGPSDDPPKADPADMSFHGSMPSSALASSASAAASSPITAAGIAVDALPQYDAARQARRQKRRHKKSITEEPEEGQEKTNGAKPGST